MTRLFITKLKISFTNFKKKKFTDIRFEQNTLNKI